MEFEKKHVIFGGFAIIVLVALYYLHSYLTTQIVHKELRNLLKHKKKNQKKFTIENTIHRREMQPQIRRDVDMENEDINMMKQQDMDSYVDVGEDDADVDAQNTPSSSKGSRISKDNIGCRDMVDGSRQ